MVAPAVQPDPADAADADDSPRCIRCHYLLKGLPDDCACPECGLPVELSHAALNPLREQDPAWLRRVGEGFSWQIGACLIALTSIFLGAVAGWQGHTPVGEGPPLPTILHVLQILSNFVAAWWVTTPEPGLAEPAVSLRRAARVTASVLMPVTLLLHYYPVESLAVPLLTYLATALLTLADN